MKANTRNLTLIILACLIVIALLVFVLPSVSKARPEKEAIPSSIDSPAITTAQTAAILGAQQLLLQSEQVHIIYVPMIVR